MVQVLLRSSERQQKVEASCKVRTPEVPTKQVQLLRITAGEGELCVNLNCSPWESGKREVCVSRRRAGERTGKGWLERQQSAPLSGLDSKPSLKGWYLVEVV